MSDFAKIVTEIGKQAVRDVEVSPATGVANRREVFDSSHLEAVVDGRAPQGVRGGDREQASLLLLLRNDARGLAEIGRASCRERV